MQLRKIRNIGYAVAVVGAFIAGTLLYNASYTKPESDSTTRTPYPVPTVIRASPTPELAADRVEGEIDCLMLALAEGKNFDTEFNRRLAGLHSQAPEVESMSLYRENFDEGWIGYLAKLKKAETPSKLSEIKEEIESICDMDKIPEFLQPTPPKTI